MAITGNLQIKNGKYYAVLNLYDEKGNRKQKWVNTKLSLRGNKKIAEKFLNEQLAVWNKNNVPYCKMKVADYFKEWLEVIATEVKPNTYRAYQGNMINHIIPYFEKEKIKLQELKPYHLEDYYRFKLMEGSKIKSDEALSPTTIKHHHQNISKALTDAVRRGLITVNPARSARAPKQEKFKSCFLNPEQLDELLTLFKGNTVEIPITLCVVYGFRRSEVLGLKWNNIDFEKKAITICETLQQHTGGNYTDTPKTESSYRTLPMTESVFELLKRHKQLQAERKKLMGNYYVASDYVCTWTNGRCISPNYLTKTFHSIISKSNLPQIRLHDLRHSVASNLLNKGFSIVQVQDWLGHGSAATTLNFYAHVDKTSKMNVAHALQEMIAL